MPLRFHNQICQTLKKRVFRPIIFTFTLMLANHEEEAHRQIRPDFRSAAVCAGWHRAQHRFPQRRQATLTPKPGRDVDTEDDGSAIAVMAIALIGEAISDCLMNVACLTFTKRAVIGLVRVVPNRPDPPSKCA